MQTSELYIFFSLAISILSVLSLGLPMPVLPGIGKSCLITLVCFQLGLYPGGFREDGSVWGTEAE